MHGKYIIFMSHYELEFPVLFPDGFVQHREISKVGKPISAGFFSVHRTVDDAWRVNCSGKSISLGLEARPDHDARLILQMFTK